jgi:hypothetical protein
MAILTILALVKEVQEMQCSTATEDLLM